MEQKSILVVEDDFSTRDLITQVLSEDLPDYNIIGAENGEQAIEILKENNTIEVCLTDGRMPRMDGFHFIAFLKKSYPQIGIIFITAALNDFKQAIMLGLDEYIEKPFDVDNLRTIVKRVIQKRNTL